MESLMLGQFNARGPSNGIEHWFDLIHDELERRGHEVRQFWLHGKQPMAKDIKDMDFALFHFSQVALYYRRIGVPYCILPSANDFFIDKGEKLRVSASYKLCKFITFQGEYHRKKLIEWKIPKPKVYVPMPARVDLFKRKKPLGSNVIAGGRLVEKKGLHQLKKISENNNLVIFGDGFLENELKKELPQARFTGYLEGGELKELMEKSWVYLFPSIVTKDNDQDGFPNTIKEALLMNLCVYASPIGGVEEIKHIDLVDDWNNLKIDDIDKEPNIKGEKYIRDNFSPEMCVHKLVKGIEEYD